MIFNSFSWAGPSIGKSDVLMSLHRVLPMIAQGQDKLNYRNSICLFIYIQISYLVGLLSTVMELHLHHFHMGVGLISFSTGSMIVIALTTLHMLVFTIDFYMCTLHSSLDHPCVNKFSLSLSIQWRPTFVLYWKQTLINSLYCLSSKSDCAPLQNLCLCWNCHTTVFFFFYWFTCEKQFQLLFLYMYMENQSTPKSQTMKFTSEIIFPYWYSTLLSLWSLDWHYNS